MQKTVMQIYITPMKGITYESESIKNIRIS